MRQPDPSGLGCPKANQSAREVICVAAKGARLCSRFRKSGNTSSLFGNIFIPASEVSYVVNLPVVKSGEGFQNMASYCQTNHIPNLYISLDERVQILHSVARLQLLQTPHDPKRFICSECRQNRYLHNGTILPILSKISIFLFSGSYWHA